MRTADLLSDKVAEGLRIHIFGAGRHSVAAAGNKNCSIDFRSLNVKEAKQLLSRLCALRRDRTNRTDFSVLFAFSCGIGAGRMIHSFIFEVPFCRN